ncbi:hypothetical protein FA95DRAFT_1554401 [Auriscalpium vulgare]|uniref:Uncharacterized protein n=1 Tax=Auriscalpium vulgare TaxID=40419 RepID=A0ACB8S699_9AGAM|nr:hypothetical protein FA95DRAFT_1554401 [Auriscalpium vulgare]
MSATKQIHRVPEDDLSFYAGNLPYKSDGNFVARAIWRWRLWFEVTFGIALFEPWERAVLLVFMIVFLSLFLAGIYKYLPQHLAFLYGRGKYYFLGTEQGDWTSVQNAFATLKATPSLRGGSEL